MYWCLWWVCLLWCLYLIDFVWYIFLFGCLVIVFFCVGLDVDTLVFVVLVVCCWLLFVVLWFCGVGLLGCFCCFCYMVGIGCSDGWF